jgi:hypothetical protein
MAELHEVIEVLARAASHSPSWSEADSNLVAEWIEDEKPPEKPAPKATK